MPRERRKRLALMPTRSFALLDLPQEVEELAKDGAHDGGGMYPKPQAEWHATDSAGQGKSPGG